MQTLIHVTLLAKLRVSSNGLALIPHHLSMSAKYVAAKTLHAQLYNIGYIICSPVAYALKVLKPSCVRITHFIEVVLRTPINMHCLASD